MADAASLHCPNCGAPVDPGLRRCPYCKARLATVSCPSCFALMFDGSAFCPGCGAHSSRADAGAAAAQCPDCTLAMRQLQVGATGLLECEKCDGIWVDGRTFEELCADREAQAAVLPQYADRPEPSRRVKYRETGERANR